MRTNLSSIVVVALAASPFTGCKDVGREVAGPINPPEDRPVAEVVEVAAAPAVRDGVEAPGIKPVTEGAGGPSAARGSVVVIPPGELAPAIPAVAPGFPPATSAAAGSAPGTEQAEPQVLPSTPGLPTPTEALPMAVTAIGPPAPTGGAGAGASGTAPETGIGGATPAEPRVALVPGEDVAVPPGAVLELASPIALADVRVRLFDENDRIVPSRDRVTVGKGTEVRIVPEAPLPPGSAFRLEIGGQLQSYPTDVEGKHFTGRTYRFHTTGEKPPPPPPPAKKQRRRR